MNTDFRIKALNENAYAALMGLGERQLAAHHARWITADAKPGYPCRATLQEAEIGERVLLLPYAHLDVDSPYRASGPVFVRENAETVVPDINEIPEILTTRLLSVRAYDQQHFMIQAETTQGPELKSVIRKQLSNSDVAYLHIHNANPGCFNCAVYRA